MAQNNSLYMCLGHTTE